MRNQGRRSTHNDETGGGSFENAQGTLAQIRNREARFSALTRRNRASSDGAIGPSRSHRCPRLIEIGAGIDRSPLEARARDESVLRECGSSHLRTSTGFLERPASRARHSVRRGRRHTLQISASRLNRRDAGDPAAAPSSQEAPSTIRSPCTTRSPLRIGGERHIGCTSPRPACARRSRPPWRAHSARTASCTCASTSITSPGCSGAFILFSAKCWCISSRN